MKNPTSESTRLETRLRSFFGLKSLPFTKDLEPDRPFSTDTFARGLDRLHYLADRQGTGVVYGTPGTGKSTLLRSFLASLPRTSHAVCYVSRTNCAAAELFREIARGFQIAPSYRKADVMREIHDRVLKLSRTQKVRPVLVLDEAHLLPSAVLDELRLLTSFEEDSRDDLTFVIAGHPGSGSTADATTYTGLNRIRDGRTCRRATGARGPPRGRGPSDRSPSGDRGCGTAPRSLHGSRSPRARERSGR